MVFPTESSGVDGKNGKGSQNVPPGLVVDTGIVHPYAYRRGVRLSLGAEPDASRRCDFYVSTHPGIQGTNALLYARVYLNEIGIPLDTLKQWTVGLAASYQKCERAVNTVSLAYYAKDLADRQRAHICSLDYPAEQTKPGSLLSFHALEEGPARMAIA